MSYEIALRENIRSVLREVLNERDAIKSKGSEEDHINHTAGCPDCYKKVMDKMNTTSTFKCSTCGLPLGNREFMEKLKTCPNCGCEKSEEIER